jgi:putative cardiolipin synthase
MTSDTILSWSQRLVAAAPLRLLGAMLIPLLMTGISACTTIGPSQTNHDSVAIAASDTTELGRIADASLGTGGESAFRPIPMSAFSMDARLTLATHAQQSLDLQYYLLQNDVTGHKLLRAVRDAALRGVRVRILVDDLYTATSDQMLVELASYPNIEIRLFNPFTTARSSASARWLFSLNEFSRLNHRMHNKMFIADGALAVAGGRNIADEYFFSSKEGNFVDFDLLIAGAAVPKLQSIFDIYWNSPRVYPLAQFEKSSDDPSTLQQSFEALTADAKTAYPTPPADQPDLLGFLPLSVDITHTPLNLLHGHIEAFADNPEKVSGRSESGTDRTTVTYRVLEAVGEANSEVVIGSPYFIPGDLGLERLSEVRQRGVAVYVITNSLASNDEPFASAAYGRYRVPMLKMGVELYELNPVEMKNDPLIGKALRSTIGRSHSKLIIIDHRTTFVGSMNMDLRSSRENTELGMLIDSSDLANNVLALANKVRSAGTFKLRLAPSGDREQWVAVENGVEKVYASEPDVSLGTEAQILFLFPFVPEGLL